MATGVLAASDAILIALDEPARRLVQDGKDYTKGYYMSLAPLVIDGKVLVGTSGGEFRVVASSSRSMPRTVRRLWRTYTIPAPGEAGSETWPKGDQWKTGGGSLGHRCV